MGSVGLPLPLTTIGDDIVAGAGGAPLRRPKMRRREFYVTDSPYDVTGEDATNDTTGLLAAIADAQDIYGTVFLPPLGAAGATIPYLINDTLTITKRIALIGMGAGDGSSSTAKAGTIIKKTADVLGIKVMAAHARLEGFNLFSALVTPTADGIWIGDADATNGATAVQVRDVWINGGHHYGLWAKNGNGGLLEYVRAQGCASHGIVLDSANTSVDNVNQWHLNGVFGMSNGGDGVHIEDSVSNTLTMIDCEGNTGYGLYINRPYQRFDGYCEFNTAGDLQIGASAFECEGVVRAPGTISVGNNNNNIRVLDGSGKQTRVMPGLGGMTGFRAGVWLTQVSPTYGTSVAVDNKLGNLFEITSTNGTGFTIGSPTTLLAGMEITIVVKNTSGGSLGAITWGGTYNLAGAFTAPATGFKRSVTFWCDGTEWFEKCRSSADVAN